MIPFIFMKMVWRIVEIYTNYVKKVKHPVKNAFLLDTRNVSIKIIIIPTLWDNYSYLIVSGNQAVIIDPSAFGPIVKEIEKRQLQVPYILVTHEHIDHISGITSLQRRYKSTIIATEGSLIPINFTGVNDGFKLEFGNIYLEVLSVPGHYSSPYPLSSISRNIAWYSKDAGVLFTGDTMFSCGYGFIKDGSEKIMWESLKKLRALPGDTLLFFGHEYSLKNTVFAREIDPNNFYLKERLSAINCLLQTNKPTIPTFLELEKEINPFLRWDESSLKKQLMISDTSEFETFLHIRKLKNEYNSRK